MDAYILDSSFLCLFLHVFRFPGLSSSLLLLLLVSAAKNFHLTAVLISIRSFINLLNVSTTSLQIIILIFHTVIDVHPWFVVSMVSGALTVIDGHPWFVVSMFSGALTVIGVHPCSLSAWSVMMMMRYAWESHPGLKQWS